MALPVAMHSYPPVLVVVRGAVEPRVNDETVTLATIARHRDLVRLAMLKVSHELERRGLAHDLSKLQEDELSGFCRINRVAREHLYGSDEYRESMKAEKATIDLHYSRNSHHPEHGRALGEAAEAERGMPDDLTYWSAHRPMGLMDLIEMVCDWQAASISYGGTTTLRGSLDVQRERFKQLSEAQWWVIMEMVNLLDPE